MGKPFVKVLAEHDELGNVKPLEITRGDGRRFEIDQVLDVRRVPSLKGGRLGMRYTCRIRGKQIYLFCDEWKWFIDK